MKAQVTCYKPCFYDKIPEEETTIKNFLELAQFLLRAGRRRYSALQDNQTGDIYLITSGPGNDFVIHFIEEE